MASPSNAGPMTQRSWPSPAKGAPIQIVERPRDPGLTHPWRQKELHQQVNLMLGPNRRLGLGDLQAVIAAHQVKRRPEWFYRGAVAGSPGQYSLAFAEWLIQRIEQDASFLAASRASARQAAIAGRERD